MSAHPNISRHEFGEYVSYLRIPESYPGIQGFGYTTRIAREAIPRLVDKMRAEGIPDFRVWPLEPDRPEYHAIIYLRPEDKRNKTAVGFDMFNEPVRRTAMAAARESGAAALSGKVELVQEIEGPKQAGFLVYLPVYSAPAVPATSEDRRNLLMGFVYSPFRADDLFNSIFGPDYVPVMLHREIYDGAEISERSLLHRWSPEESRPRKRDPMQAIMPFTIAGARWTLVFAAPAGFETGGLVAPLTLLGGIVLSMVLFYLTVAQARARHQAELNAEQLRLSEQDLMEARQKLEEHTTELESRVSERTSQLEQSLADLERVLYHVAHDLRAPARAMGSFAVLLMEEYGEKLDERGVDYLKRISGGAQRMDRLVSDLLAYGRTAHMPLPTEPVKLEDRVEAALRFGATRIQATGATVEVERPLPTVMANSGALGDIIWQLLSNALKYVPAGKKPVVRIYARTSGNVRLCIEDNGIGIRPEHQQRIFRVFERLHAAHEYSGTGIGLAIAAKAIERMGGSIGLESSEGNGSCFWIELPPA